MEVMKSIMIALWDGLNFPYQIRFTEIFPVRRGPLWYWNLNCWSDSVSCLAEIMWSREIVRKSVKIKFMLKNAIWDLYLLLKKNKVRSIWEVELLWSEVMERSIYIVWMNLKGTWKERVVMVKSNYGGRVCGVTGEGASY
jgi:hypothetical protein